MFRMGAAWDKGWGPKFLNGYQAPRNTTMVVPVWISTNTIYIMGNLRSLGAYKSNGTKLSLTNNIQMSI